MEGSSRESSFSSMRTSFADRSTNHVCSEVSYSDARSSSDTLHLRAVHSSDEALSGYGTPLSIHDESSTLSKQLSNYFKEIGETERRVGIVNISKSIGEYIAKKNQLHPSSTLWKIPERLLSKESIERSIINSSSSLAVIRLMKQLNKLDIEDTDDDNEGYETPCDEDRKKMEEFKNKWIMSEDDKKWLVSVNLEEFHSNKKLMKQSVNNRENEEQENEQQQQQQQFNEAINVDKASGAFPGGGNEILQYETDLIAQLESNAIQLSSEQKGKGMTFPRDGDSPSSMRDGNHPWRTWPMRGKVQEPTGRVPFLRRLLNVVLCRKKRNTRKGSKKKCVAPTPPPIQQQFGLSKAQEKELRFISKFYKQGNSYAVGCPIYAITG